MTESKIKQNKEIRQNTGAILNPASCGSFPTRNFLSVGFTDSGICEYIPPTGQPEEENNLPVIDLNGGSAGLNISDTFTEGDVATAYLSSAIISDADNDLIVTATIVGAGIQDGSSEILVIGGTSYPLNANKTATGTGGSTTFSIAYTTATQTFVITKNGGGGVAIADIQSLIRGISYRNISEDPASGNRVFTFTVNDGEGTSSPATLTIAVSPVNDAPVVDLNGAGGGINASGTFTEGDAFTSYISSATLTDADSDPLVSLVMTCGGQWGANGPDELIKFDTWVTDSDTDKTENLVVGSTTFSLAFISATGVLTITKSGGGTFPAADGQALIRLFQYVNPAEPPTEGDRTFTWVSNDGTDNSTAAVLTVTVAANVAPVIDLVNTTGTFTEGDDPTQFIADSTIADVDDTELVSLTVTCGDQWGDDGTSESLAFGAWTTNADTDLTDTVSFGTTTFQIAYVALTGVATITKSGGGVAPIEDWQLLQQAFAYDNAVTPPTAGDRTFTFVANDGVDNSNSATLTITVAVDSTPAITFEDTFTDTDGVDLNAHTPEVDAVGNGWVLRDDTVEIQSNAAVLLTGGTGLPLGLATFESTSADGRLTCQWAGTTGGTASWGMVFRYNPSDGTFLVVLIRYDGTTRLFQYNGSAYVQIGTNYSGTTVSGEVAVNFNADTIEVYDNGTLLATFTSSINQTQVHHGLRMGIPEYSVTYLKFETPPYSGGSPGGGGGPDPTEVDIDAAWLTANGPAPYYLDIAGCTYTLLTDVAADGTAFCIIAEDIVFDLNTHQITYDNATPIVIPNGSFEDGTGAAATGWDFTNAPSAERYAGVWLDNEIYDGDYSIKFTDTTIDQDIVSTTTITLEANTTYSLSGMFEWAGVGNPSNPGVKGYVRLVGDGLPTIEASHSTNNNRGIQLRETEFTTGGSPAEYYVHIGIEGHASGAYPMFIDDVKVQRTKTYGVAIGVQSWAMSLWPGVTESGSGTNATVKNGTIVQGSDGATWGHAIHYRAHGVTLQDLTITLNGANGSAIYTTSSNQYDTTITGCDITSNVQTITSRDNGNGAVMFYVQGTIANNTINNGPISGIKCGGNGTIISEVYGNTVQLKSKYTNNFAISGGVSSQIYNNTVDSGSGEYTSRGIAPGDGQSGSPSRCYGNTITVQQLANNQEYGSGNAGVPLGGVFGIQCDGSSYVEIYDNDVTVNGVTEGFCFRITNYANNITVHDNTFTANATTGRACALSFYSFEQDTFSFYDNTIVTNDGICGECYSDNLGEVIDLVRCTITVNTPVADPYIIWSYPAGAGLHTILRFVDTVFTDSTAADYLRDATCRGNAGGTEVKLSFALDWTTTLHVVDSLDANANGATVVIEDATAVEVVNDTTDASGNLVVELRELQKIGATQTDYTPHAVDVTYGAETDSDTITADQVQTVELATA